MTWRPPNPDEMLVVAVGCGRRVWFAAESSSLVRRRDRGGPPTVAAGTNPRSRFARSFSDSLLTTLTEVMVLKRIRDRVAGLDVHRDMVFACCWVVDPDGEVEVTKQSFATTRKGLGELAVFLCDVAVTTVAMEAAGLLAVGYVTSPMRKRTRVGIAVEAGEAT